MLNIFARAPIARVLDPVGAALLRVGLTPNVVTLLGTVGAIACAVGFFPNGMLLWGTFTVWAFAMVDLIDGAMARASAPTPFGEVLDATCDRLVDGAVFGSIAWWCFVVYDNRVAAALALFVLVMAQVISYVKARAQATGLSADGGLLERAERLIIGLVGTGLQGVGVPGAVLVSLVVLAVLSTVTIVQRLLAASASTRSRERV